MTDLHALIAALEQTGDPLAQSLKDLAAQAGRPVEPPKPPTILDEVREVGLDAVELVVSEVPALHEVPYILGVLIKRVYELENPEPASSPAPVEPPQAPPAPVEPAAGQTIPPPIPADQGQATPAQPAGPVAPAQPPTAPAPAAPQWPASEPPPVLGQ